MSGTAFERLVWSDQAGVAGVLARIALLPASALFRIGAALHHASYDARLRGIVRAEIPVISVGNLRVGGAGKTPFTGWVVDRLVELGRQPAVLHGGYGSDEPALHRRWRPEVPVLVGRDRVACVREARQSGRDVAVLDDGFQHRRLARDLNIVLLAAEHGIDRIRLLPRGPWREPLSALRRADVVVVTRKIATHERADQVIAAIRNRVERRALHAWIRPISWRLLDGSAAEDPTGEAVAVAAIAEPDSFFDTIAGMGLRLARRLAYPDHHDYTEEDLDEIVRAAEGRPILTTAKDAVKLGDLSGLADVFVLEQQVEIEDGEPELMQRIQAAVAGS